MGLWLLCERWLKGDGGVMMILWYLSLSLSILTSDLFTLFTIRIRNYPCTIYISVPSGTRKNRLALSRNIYALVSCQRDLTRPQRHHTTTSAEQIRLHPRQYILRTNIPVPAFGGYFRDPEE
jgi:hypothetical protein